MAGQTFLSARTGRNACPTCVPRLLLAALVLAAGWGAAAQDAPPPRAEGAEKVPVNGDINARRKLDSAKELLALREYDRAVKLLESILESYPEDPIRFPAYLALGKHYLEQRQLAPALGFLIRLNALEKPDEPLVGEEREVFLEGLYLTGVTYFEQHQYERAFPVLRRITSNYPHTPWANQAYYYIGMSHFAMGHWNKAIEALGLVGTSVDPDSPAVEYAEAGRRFYVKISDGDLPILHRLGKEVTVEVQTHSGDREKLICIPLTGKADVFIGSTATEIGPPKPGDAVLQVVSGDILTTRYLDDNTQSGDKDVPRVATVKAVSTGILMLTTATYESPAPAAFLRQPLFMTVWDADPDLTAAADVVAVRLYARYREEEPADALIALTEQKPEEERWKVRDQVTLTLTELGAPPVRTGKFGGSVKLEPALEGQAPDQTDGILSCQVNDEVLAVYVDDRYLGGTTPREVKARIEVSGELENRPRAELYVVTDPLLRAKKNNVEATAYLELARIFKSMGLQDGARSKADEGLALVEVVVRSSDRLPASLRERAFELKWELELAKDDFAAALASCEIFSKLFPHSPLADQALLGMGKARMEAREFAEASNIFKRILALPQSQAKAEAQFLLAQATETAAEVGRPGTGADSAIRLYQQCADKYPGSEFAGPALAKVVDYHIRSKDFAQADDLLEQIFNDHPDAKFLDSMLLKWAIVAFRREDFGKAQQKLTQLVFEYPESKYAEEARKLLPQVEAKLKK
jgi:outer membrane protein assembly factor BamD (BamD/ComL family)